MNKVINEIKSNSKVNPCLFYPIIKEMGLSMEELLTDSQSQSRALLAIADKYPASAVIRMTELWCEGKAFGMECDLGGRGFPVLGKPLFEDAEDMEDISIPQVENETTAPLLEAVRLAVPKMDKPLIVGVTAPYTLASVLGGSEDFMMSCITDPELVHAFLDQLTDFLIEYISAYKALGAAGIILAEPTIAMISPQMTQSFSNNYIKKIIDAVKDDNFAVIYHNCGAVNPHLEEIISLDADAFHFGDDIDLNKVLSAVSKDKLVMGNIDPRVLLSAAPEDITQATRKLVDKYAAYDNWQLSSGCDLAPATPQENLAALFAAATP